jgi:hypothetical protein
VDDGSCGGSGSWGGTRLRTGRELRRWPYAAGLASGGEEDRSNESVMGGVGSWAGCQEALCRARGEGSGV